MEQQEESETPKNGEEMVPLSQHNELRGDMSMLATELAGLALEMATIKAENAQLLRSLNSVKAQMLDMQARLDVSRGGGDGARASFSGDASRDSTDRVKLSMILASHVDHYRQMHATRDELVMACRFSYCVYATKLVEDAKKPGFSVQDWEYFRTLTDDAQLEAAVYASLKGHFCQKTYPTFAGRCVKTVQEFPDMSMIAHVESDDQTFDGECAIFRSDSRKTIMVVWRGTDSARDASWDVKSYRTAPWCSSDERVRMPTASRSASLLADTGASVGFTGMRDRMSKALEGSESKSPLHHKGKFAQLRVGAGFLQQYLGEGLNRRVNEVINEQLSAHSDYSILVTGHSLGGACATLSAYEAASTHLDTHVLLITFGAPRTVNGEFSRVMSRMPNLRAYRVTNELDPVSRVPSSVNGFQHVGHMIWLHRKVVEPPRPFGSMPMQLKVMPLEIALGNISGIIAHQMEVYVPRMCDPEESYSWERYEKSLRMQAQTVL